MDGLEAFFTRAFEERGRAQEPAWLKSLRGDAFARYRSLGLPTTKHEDWKYLSLSGLPALELRHIGGGENNRGHYRSRLGPDVGPALRGNFFLFADGVYSSSLDAPELPKGVRVRTVAEVIREGGKGLESALDAYPADDGIKALNTALFADGAWIEVDPGVVVDRPVHLLFHSTHGHAPFLRNTVVLGEGSELRLIEEYSGMGPALTSSVTLVRQGRGSQFKHLKIQDDARGAAHFSDLRVNQTKDSRFESLALSLGGAIGRNEIHTTLAEENAECRLLGLYAAAEKQQLDNFSVIDHASPHCRSHETYKGILAGEAKGAFTGRIVVRKDAQKTDSHQMNRSLLLSERALANTRPQLQIHADDVKCAHGATVGRLDPEQLFYLRSRGIGLDQARRLVCRAYAGEILEQGGWGPELGALFDRWLERLATQAEAEAQG